MSEPEENTYNCFAQHQAVNLAEPNHFVGEVVEKGILQLPETDWRKFLEGPTCLMSLTIHTSTTLTVMNGVYLYLPDSCAHLTFGFSCEMYSLASQIQITHKIESEDY